MDRTDRDPADDLPLTPEDVEEIVSILATSSYDTLDIETGRFRLRVSRAGEGWTQEWTRSHARLGGDDVGAASGRDPEPVADSAGLSRPGGRALASRAPSRTPLGRSHKSDDGLLLIRPPLPGTFYRAPQPGAPPFVAVGDRVSRDTVVAIVETMKLMTPVHAGVAGRIVEIVAQNAETIEEGSILMKVAPE